MISNLFYALIYTPLYNALIGLLSFGTFIDVGIAVIILTAIVKIALSPLSLKAARTQRLMKQLEEPMKEIREKYKDKREEQGRKLLELYKEKGVNPFSGFVVLFIQLPIILGLYWVFLKAGLPDVDTSLLYSFINKPEEIQMYFLGVVDMASKSIPLAGLAGVTQYFQARFALPAPTPRKDNATFQEDFARSLQLQMRYVFPFLIMVIAYVASAAVALYWITSNIFAIGQEIYVKRVMQKEEGTTEAEDK